MNNIDTTKWKDYEISKLFIIKSPASRTIKTYNEGNVPYVSSGGINNGILSYLEPKEGEELEKGNCISVSPLEGTPCFYQKNDFLGRGGAGSAVSLLYNNHLTEYNALYICEVIKLFAKKFDYADAFTSNNLKKLLIKLPSIKKKSLDDDEKKYTVDGYVPDWDYMEKYMITIEPKAQNRIDNIKYIKGNQTTIDIVEWEKFHLYDDCLFTIDSGSKLDKSKMQVTNPTVAFVGRSGTNNGVTAEVDLIEGVNPYPAGCMTIALGGSIGACFVQQKQFYTSQNVIVLIPKWKMSDEVKLFIASVIYKESQMHYKTFEDELNRHISTDFSIMLPVKSKGNPNWKYMEKFVSNIQDKSQKRIDIFSLLTKK